MLNSVLIAIASVVVILGFMVLIHEFGHYAVAKLLGVRVEQFAIGFGKRLVGFRKGETDYRINAIPLGGYVKMSGENPMDRHTDDPREFVNHSRWHRFLIAIAGPVMNILLAIVLLTGVYMVHYEPEKDESAVVGDVRADSPAAKIGVRPGDRIIKIDGIDNPTWEQVLTKDALNANQRLHVVIQRGNTTIDTDVVPQPITVNEIGSSGWYPSQPIIVGNLESGPAQKAGIKDGDRIVAMDGKPLASLMGLKNELQKTKDKPVDLTVERGAETLHITVQPEIMRDPSAGQVSGDNWLVSFLRKIGWSHAATHAKEEPQYRIGFTGAPPTIEVVKLPLGEAFARSLDENRNNSTMLISLVGKLLQHKVSLKAVSGPIGIAQMTGAAAQSRSWVPLLELTCLISLNLGIFNLLPIPIMDGGVILLLFIEALMRRDISLPVKERIYQAAFVFLVLFAAVVIYNDIVKTLATRQP